LYVSKHLNIIIHKEISPQHYKN